MRHLSYQDRIAARLLGGSRGFTLMELLTAALLFSLVGLAMGVYYVFSVQRVEEGVARAELQRNGALVLQALASTIREGNAYRIPAEGEPSGSASITVYFPLHEEPYEDENLNGQWDPGERFQDLNGNGVWDGVPTPARSFRLYANQLDVLEEGAQSWKPYLDNRYAEAGASSVRIDELAFVPDAQDPKTIQIRFVLRDDRRTPSDPADDLMQTFELRVCCRG